MNQAERKKKFQNVVEMISSDFAEWTINYWGLGRTNDTLASAVGGSLK